MQAPQGIDTAATEALARISQDPEVAKGRDLARRFAELIGRCGVRSDARPANPSASSGTWLTDALSCGILAVEAFAVGARRDEAAVKAALTLPWSSGQAEGQVNKLKLIKRQM